MLIYREIFMGDMGDLYRDLKKIKKEGKWRNLDYAENVLRNYEHRRVDEYLFYIGHPDAAAEFEFWPSTGLFKNRQTGKKGRGINNLLPMIEKFKREVL